MAVSALLWFGQDFRSYYAAARALLAGSNPYDYHVLAPILLEITGQIGNYAYYYAPWFAWFIIPLAWLPFDLARALWMLLNLVLWNVSLWQLCKLLDWPRLGWRRYSLCLLFTFLFAWITWRYEQAGILLFALLVGVLFALRDRHGGLAGAGLALLLVKPNVTLIPVAALTLWLVRRRDWQPVIAMGILTLGMLVAAFLVTPNLVNPFFEASFGQGLYSVLDGPEQIVATRLNTTLYDWLVVLSVSPELARALALLTLLTGVAILVVITWRSDSAIQVVVASLLVSFAVTPYALQYDYPPLTLVLLWALSLSRYGQPRWRLGVGILIVSFIASVPFWERPISDGYWIVIGLIGLTIWNRSAAAKAQRPSAAAAPSPFYR